MPVLNAAKSTSTQTPYFTRLTPVIGELGYTRKRNNESEFVDGIISVYDDTAENGVIKAQFRQQRQPNAKVAVFTFDSVAAFDEMLSDLTAVRDTMLNVTEPTKPTEAPTDAPALPALKK